MEIKVHTHIAGSVCVIQFANPTPWNCNDPWHHYIDVKPCRSLGVGLNLIETVVGGHVRCREYVRIESAPERLIELMRERAR